MLTGLKNDKKHVMRFLELGLLQVIDTILTLEDRADFSLLHNACVCLSNILSEKDEECIIQFKVKLSGVIENSVRPLMFA